MKATVEFKENALGHVECEMDVPPGTCTPKEKAYMEEFIAAFRAAAPNFGKKRGALAIMGLSNAKPENQ